MRKPQEFQIVQLLAAGSECGFPPPPTAVAGVSPFGRPSWHAEMGTPDESLSRCINFPPGTPSDPNAGPRVWCLDMDWTHKCPSTPASIVDKKRETKIKKRETFACSSLFIIQHSTFLLSVVVVVCCWIESVYQTPAPSSELWAPRYAGHRLPTGDDRRTQFNTAWVLGEAWITCAFFGGLMEA